MGTELYLDTARLGRMCDGARLAEREFGWLTSRLGSSLYLEKFLTHGWHALPAQHRDLLTNLKCWQGVQVFRERLSDFVGQPSNLSTHLFGQSSSLVHFAADCLWRRCERLLVTDLVWPAYLRVFEETASTCGKSVHCISIRDQILQNQITASEVIGQIVSAYDRRGCDGVFLSDISFLGVRLPVIEVIAKLRDDCRFAIVDGAQAFNHRPVNIRQLNCDLYLAGTQKWLRSYHPLRIAFTGRNENSDLVNDVAAQHVHRDPLHGFIQSLTAPNTATYGETVNVSALIAAAGALSQMTRWPADLDLQWNGLLANRAILIDQLKHNSVQWLNLSDSFTSGILLGQLSQSKHRSVDRSTLARCGLVASGFPGGILRVSAPVTPLTPAGLATLNRAFRRLVPPTQQPNYAMAAAS